MGIRGQLTLLVPGIVALALALGTFLEVRREQRESVEDFRLRNEKVLQSIGVTVAVNIAQNDMSGLDTLIAQLSESMRERDLKELAVLDDQGRVLAHSEPERFNTIASDAFSQTATQVEGVTWERQGESFRISVPAVSGIRWGTVTATYSLDRLGAQLARTRLRLGITSALLFLVLGAILFVGLDRLVVRPVRTLQTAVRRMGEGHLSTRVPPLRGSELGELTNTINRMASALQHERENLERSVTERTKELQDANARLERLAVTDGLTGVFNHRRFQEQLQAELLRCERHKRPMGVLMVDVDFFKKVNDAMGHPAGDELLRRLAEVLSIDLRQTDLIARYGGEEFAVLLPETTKSEAMQVAERMRLAVEEKINDGKTPWPAKVTVSIGVGTFPEDGKSGEQVLSAADQAMYVAKRQGRNRVIGARGVIA
ncbi:MAG: diguanylate cyclase [Archangium sp.]|nr:diguanylate cyclase [Archangium sp.]MDP3570948.1 diguanylate cyclase [Archangium sp.]